MALLTYIERLISYLFYNNRNNLDLLFTCLPPLAALPSPNIPLTSPDCGPTDSTLPTAHTQDGPNDLYPTFEWTLPEDIKDEVREYVLVCEDADLPIPRYFARGIFHSIIYAIPGDARRFSHADLALSGDGNARKLKSGYRFVPNMRGKPYSGARPLVGHGEHRYYYQLVALDAPIDLEKVGEKGGKEEVVKEVEGKVMGWGSWVGRYERTGE
ncbi:hypothetical protein MMC21_005659 [Puttea exsequens]|nr:hypothetical protein [Puttea exsequens]